MTTPHDHQTFHIKEGDRLPVLEVHLVDCEGAAMDLTPYPDVFLKLAACVGGRKIVDMAPMERVLPLTDGIVRYAWAEGDTDQPGDYHLEVVLSPDYDVVPASDQELLTMPGGGYGKVKITPRL